MKSSIRMTSWLYLLVSGALVVLLTSTAGADAPALTKTIYTYKSVGKTKIKADVYRATNTTVQPVVVWLHGGALIVGSRSAVPRRLLELCRQEGFVLVSFDYRLAPEVKLPAIIEDVRDRLSPVSEERNAPGYYPPALWFCKGQSAQ
jgi:acetyl esterase/lipase